MEDAVPHDARVCPECGNLAGDQPFCGSCGLNLTQVERLPSRGEWERLRPPEPDSESAQSSARTEARIPVTCAVCGAADYGYERCGACGVTLRDGDLPTAGHPLMTIDPTASQTRPSVPEPRADPGGRLRVWGDFWITRRQAWATALLVASTASIVVIVILLTGGGGANGTEPGSNVSPIRLQDALASAQPDTTIGPSGGPPGFPISWSCTTSASCNAYVSGVMPVPYEWFYSVTWDTGGCFTATLSGGAGSNPSFINAQDTGIPQTVQGCA